MSVSRRWLFCIYAIGGVLFFLAFIIIYRMRSERLAGVPDVGPPFDVQLYGMVSVNDSDNAYPIYKEATDMLIDMSEDGVENLDEVREQGWQVSSDDLKKWLADNQPALEIWQRGTKRPDYLKQQPNTYTINTLLPVTQSLRSLSRLAVLDGQRLYHEGDLHGAWERYRDNLLCSRHVGMHGCMLERMVGVETFNRAADVIFSWSANPKLTAEDLRKALVELDSIYEQTLPLSESLRTEYYITTNLFELLSTGGEEADELIPDLAAWNWIFLDLIEEDELSRRLARLFYANWLSQSDVPLYQRTNYMPDPLIPYEPDPDAPSKMIPLSGEEFREALDRSIWAKSFLPAVAQADESITREQTRYAALRTALALQIHHRQHGRFPKAFEDLLGTDLKTLPVDPYGLGEPFGYRLDEATGGVTLWSIAGDGIDQAGEMDWEYDEQPGDWIFKLSPPSGEEKVEK